VAKILVADDNSNIQKMVGLALKDHGIEVVAVGNGEAAVRKISDIHPDLVLADVFMPVRNGYEVCKYVKDDSALSHIPVILLVGAFDPLDEQEAQRAGADGVLKKPFVPPDPLISMVKSALVRAGVAHAGFTPPKPAAEAAPEPPVEVAPPAPLPSFETESFVDEVPARPAAVKIESDQPPVAFGSLLGTEEEDAAMTAVPAIDRDWRTEEVEEEEEEQETDSMASWRREGEDDDSGGEPPAHEGGWRDSVSDKQPVHAHAKHHEPWTPTREKQDMSEAAETEGEVSGSPISDFRNIPAAPFSGDAWAAAIEAGGQNHTAVAEAERPAIHDSVASRVAPDLDTLVGHAEPEMESVPVVEEQSFVTETRVPAPTPAVHAAEEPTSAPEETRQASEPSSFVSEPVTSSASSWFSTPPSPWEAEMQKASKLASTWDTPAAPPVTIETHPSEPSPVASNAPDEIEVVSGAAVSAVIPEAVETAREEASHGATEVDMNAVVERVMARMSPDKLHELTRDLLKPVIEGIVREELNKKS
jgi:CheY-like chemotaxis protein